MSKGQIKRNTIRMFVKDQIDFAEVKLDSDMYGTGTKIILIIQMNSMRSDKIFQDEIQKSPRCL